MVMKPDDEAPKSLKSEIYSYFETAPIAKEHRIALVMLVPPDNWVIVKVTNPTRAGALCVATAEVNLTMITLSYVQVPWALFLRRGDAWALLGCSMLWNPILLPPPSLGN